MSIPNDTIYIVSAIENNKREPVVAAFSNKGAAEEYYKYALIKYDDAFIDEAPLYKRFILTWEGDNE